MVIVYQANIQSLDTEIGRLLAEVDLETTTVIFVGDNGVPPPVKDATGGLRSTKGSVYEGGVRVPLIVAGAGVTRRGREDELFVTTDLYATILNLTEFR
jgi:arylsulfatase A-like enzyme